MRLTRAKDRSLEVYRLPCGEFVLAEREAYEGHRGKDRRWATSRVLLTDQEMDLLMSYVVEARAKVMEEPEEVVAEEEVLWRG